MLMNKNRFAKPMAVAAGMILLCAAPSLTRAQSASPGPVQAPTAASQGAHAKAASLPADDFAGLNFTNEQKAEIAKVRLDTKSRKEVVAKDEKLTADQKDAMLLGYTRLEYGMIYRVLSPEQKREVSQRNRARRAADQAAKAKQAPPNHAFNTPAK
jgi:Spy/CpxP family protein refolding chaperone